MSGKIRVSIVATSLNGSAIKQESRPIFNLVSSSNNRNGNFPENLFSKSNIENNVVSSIDGATALKLDESYEIKNNDEQSALIDSFEKNEENKIADKTIQYTDINENEEIPKGVSIESASYMENNVETNAENANAHDHLISENKDEEYTPKLFSEELGNEQDLQESEPTSDKDTDHLFDQDNNEDEDFEIPAFLRRQKF